MARKRTCLLWTLILVFILVCCFPLTALAGTGTTNHFIWNDVTGGVEITGYEASGSNAVVVPDTLSGKNVVEIGSNPFKNKKTTITSVDLSQAAHLVTIDNSAFANCTALKTVTFSSANPGSLTTINGSAFYGCTALQSISIPDSVTTLKDGVLDGCSNLTTAKLPKNITEIPDDIFMKCTKLATITLPTSYTKVGMGAFEQTLIASFTLPDGVKSIGDYAFNSCTNLTAFTIQGSTLTAIGEDVFSGDHFTSITLPDSVATMGNGAFSNCDQLTSITLSYGLHKIEKNMFSSCFKLNNVNVPINVTEIGDYAFFDCNALTNITIGRSLKTLGAGAFGNSDNLENITLPDALTSIGNEAFKGCPALDKVTIKSDAATFGSDVFLNSGMTSSLTGDKGLYGYDGSSTKTYANAHSIPFHVYPVGTADIKVNSAGLHAIKITWNYVEGASFYEIWRSTTPGGTPFKITGLNFGPYTDTGLTTGQTYYYKVRGYHKIGSTVEKGGWSDQESTWPAPLAPANVKAASNGYTSIKISWDAVSGASGYYIYSVQNSDGSGIWTKVGTVTKGSTLNFTHKNLITNQTYNYSVVAYKTVNGNPVQGYQSAIASAKPVPAAPTGLKAQSAGYNSVKVSWNAVTGASGYYIYRASSATGRLGRIGTVPAGLTSYTDHNLKTGTTYYYSVAAYTTVSGTNVVGKHCTAVSCKPVPAKVTGLTVAKASAASNKLTWTEVLGATQYEIWRKTGSGGTYEKIDSTSSTTYTTGSNLQSGKTYYYKVKAYRVVDSKNVYGSFSDEKHITM